MKNEYVGLVVKVHLFPQRWRIILTDHCAVYYSLHHVIQPYSWLILLEICIFFSLPFYFALLNQHQNILQQRRNDLRSTLLTSPNGMVKKTNTTESVRFSGSTAHLFCGQDHKIQTYVFLSPAFFFKIYTEFKPSLLHFLHFCFAL